MLHHVRAGQGPALLLVHGISMSHRAWDDVVEELAADFEVWAVDLPGFGDSAPLIEPPTLPRLANTCGAFMAAHGHDRFLIAGSSLGGGVALQLALEGRVDAACALAPVGFAEGWELTYLHAYFTALPVLMPRIAPLMGSKLARRVLLATAAAHPERVTPETVRTAIATVDRPGLAPTNKWALGWQAPVVESLPCPVTVAWGDKDRLLLHQPQSARAQERWPAATHRTLEDVGHLPMWDDPGRTAQVIRDALAG